MRILIISPRAPFSQSGACEKDRTQGILDFVRLGHTVHVITKMYPADEELVHEFSKRNQIAVRGVEYTEVKSFSSRVRYWIRIIMSFGDGAAAEFADRKIKQEVSRALDAFKPDVVWFEYTYLWPLYSMVRRRNIPIITRSHNFEPTHFLDEKGRRLSTYIRYPSKLLSEFMVARMSNVVCAITPYEAARYRQMGAKNVRTLPLRDLPNVLAHRNMIKDALPLKCCFMGSTYSVPHNRKALHFLLTRLIPQLRQKLPGNFEFYITGKKLPEEYDKYLTDDVQYLGYVKDLDTFLDSMDVAVVPSIAGHGMQQKIFEPLARGLPTITHCRGLAGYPFIDGVHLICANSDQEFIDKMICLKDSAVRNVFSDNARALAENLFSRSAMDTIVTEVVEARLQ